MNAIEVRSFDVITDEYGNLYQPAVITTKDGKLTELKISNIYFETAFENLFHSVDTENEYKYKHIGSFLQDIVNEKIEAMHSEGRRIYSIQEFITAGVKVSESDLTAPHPRSSR